MAKVVVKSKIKKVKKKFPIKIMAPKFLNSKVLGESSVTDLKAMIGRVVKMNMMYITGSLKNQNIRLKFRIESVDSGNAISQICEYEHIAYYLKRNIKNSTDLVEDRIVFKLKTGEEIIVKPIIISKSKISTLTKKNLRAQLRELVKQELGELDVEKIFSDVLDGKIQLKLKNALKKITPLKTLEFKKIIVNNNNNNNN